jgi:hypothetical protein
MRFKDCLSFICLAFACILGLATIGSQAEAASFNEVMIYTPNMGAEGGMYYETITNPPATPATLSYAKSDASGSVTGYGYADLSTGTLKMQGSAESGVNSQWPSLTTNVSFGDGFTTTSAGGAPFIWSSSTEATFNLQLDGSYSSLFTQNPTGPSSQGGAFVVLMLYQRGTLNSNDLLGSNLSEYFLWEIGDPTTLSYTNPITHERTPLTVTDFYGDVPSTLSATFAPGGDFDWALLIGVSGQVMNEGDFFNANLADTVKLSYVAPEGTITTSDSGIFPGTVSSSPVPEPTSLLLLGSGLGMIGFAARRKRK